MEINQTVEKIRTFFLNGFIRKADYWVQMVPEIKFYTSPVYESQLSEYSPQKPNRLSPEKFRELVISIKRRKEQLQGYVKILTKLLKINWNRKELEIWLINVHHRSFSHPTTISIVDESGPRDVEEVLDIIMHELTHVMLGYHPLFASGLEQLKEEFPTATFTTRVHILVHSVLARYYQTVRGEHRMRMDIQYLEKYPEYKQSWEIVLEKGPEYILEKYLQIKKE